MKLRYYASKSRGLTALGWLVSKHLFSFGDYIDIQRMRFGALRVFNDDLILGGTGFGPHPHDNMEIVTVALRGALKHEDSLGNSGIISAGDVQTMSAGSGVTHSEMNASETEAAVILQLWIDTEHRDIKPSYDQKSFGELSPNTWHVVAAPATNGAKHAIIHQQAWVHRAVFDAGTKASYTVKNLAKDGLFLFVIDGEAAVGEQRLEKGDSLGIYETATLDIDIKTTANLLLIEMPMK